MLRLLWRPGLAKEKVSSLMRGVRAARAADPCLLRTKRPARFASAPRVRGAGGEQTTVS